MEVEKESPEPSMKNEARSDVRNSTYNPTPHVLDSGQNAAPLEVIGATAADKLVIIMVGLPACGKTHVSKRISRYISFFLDIDSQIFNSGEYRRQICGEKQPASFFDPKNEKGAAQRLVACNAALKDLIEYMAKPGVRLGIFDATNSTRERRRHLRATLLNSGVNTKVVFIEIICNDQKLLEENIRTVKLSTPDYRGSDPEEAVKDFKERRRQYQSTYESIEDGEGAYIKVLDCKKFVVHNIRGYLPLKIVHFVMNLHTLPRKIYLSRHGQSEYNVLGKIGGDSSLSKAGEEYAKRLATFAKEYIATTTEKDSDGMEVKVERPARLWTSTLKRTKETVKFIDHSTIEHTWDNGDKGEWVQFRPTAKPNLDEIYAGTCDGMTYGEIEQTYPEEFALRQADKLSYRYPRGESYMDVTLRLEPLAHEMERLREPLLIVGHQGIHRILYAYFMGMNRDEAPYVSIPLNTVIELTPHAYGCHEKRICLMDKREMLMDGQDEPVTSMPTSNKSPGKDFESNDDPILNAPSH